MGHIRVRDCGGGARLMLEPLDAFLIFDQPFWQQLNGHLAAQAFITREIDLAHAPESNSAENCVLTQGLAGQ
jgi:hypothetical protein